MYCAKILSILSKNTQYTEQNTGETMIRPQFEIFAKRMNEKRRFIQVLAGSRQVGKSTIIRQFFKNIDIPHSSESADGTQITTSWIEQLWNTARTRVQSSGEFILCIDEVQKIPNWSETIKKLWDEDTRNGTNIKLALCGSSRLLLEKGLTESLAGRFELIHVPHWSFKEMQEAFGVSLEQYIYFGGYPGAADFTSDEERWKSYIRESIIEASVAKDILMLTQITKPALLRQLFDIGSYYSSQILSYNKMLGQLTDAGNTTTLAHYLTLLNQAGLLCGLQKYSGSLLREKSSSPKFQVYNNALMTTVSGTTFETCRNTPDMWGRFVESAVGAHLVNGERTGGYTTSYWRNANDEVDFVLSRKEAVCAIEVKSGRRKTNRGMDSFKKLYPNAKIYAVSAQPASATLGLEEFLGLRPEELL